MRLMLGSAMHGAISKARALCSALPRWNTSGTFTLLRPYLLHSQLDARCRVSGSCPNPEWPGTHRFGGIHGRTDCWRGRGESSISATDVRLCREKPCLLDYG